MKKVTVLVLGAIVLILSACGGGPGANNSSAANSSQPAVYNAVYVATNGSDGNSGLTPATAMLSIYKAVDVAASNGRNKVYVAQGIYTPLKGMTNYAAYSCIYITNNNIQLTGGWNPSFSQQNGYSTLDAQKSNSVIRIDNSTNIMINGFIVINGFNNSGVAGAIYFRYISNSIVTNCILSNNSGASLGGGLCLSGSYSNRVFVSAMNNANLNNGGGLAINNSDCNYIECNLQNNSSTNRGGGMYISSSHYNTVRCLITGNYSDSGGAVYINSGTNNSFVSCVMTGNASPKGIIFLTNAIMTNLMLSNCLIGGTGTETGIFESTNIGGQVLLDNQFYTNQLGALYHDSLNGDLTDIADVNNTAKTGAKTASGNAAVY